MRVLLDTHVLLALLDEGSVDLPSAMRVLLNGSDVEALVSVASLWEIAIKQRLDKLALAVPLAELPERLEAAGLAVLPVEHGHVLFDVAPMPVTRNPFDRLLLAVAAFEKAPLLTIDDRLRDHPLAWTGRT